MRLVTSACSGNGVDFWTLKWEATSWIHELKDDLLDIPKPPDIAVAGLLDILCLSVHLFMENPEIPY
uniref:Uncharacterized protein n=1 Tax=Ixodes ricinus TaxID=34613 RepID=A0A6B0TQG9_IXORI